MERRDPSTRGHSRRVVELAEPVALGLGWRAERIAGLRLGGSLHDVGKLSISPRLLDKPGPLTPDELAAVRRHPTVGARLLAAIPEAQAALPYVLYHHERWDGSGYPAGCAGDEIPEEARLLAVADAFDAMTSHRPYRRPLGHGLALRELDRCAGSQFDPVFAQAFLEVWGASARAAS
ncbi:MAG TPA: HD-GYP domain-containing protein [Gaiellaceae bacterium]|nr:HD-GYP domain-containing protein [Gaiellaceae bacterium]